MTEDEREPIEDARGGYDSPDEPDLREQEREEDDEVTIPAAPPPAH
jgi:hypothetical protein